MLSVLHSIWIRTSFSSVFFIMNVAIGGGGLFLQVKVPPSHCRLYRNHIIEKHSCCTCEPRASNSRQTEETLVLDLPVCFNDGMEVGILTEKFCLLDLCRYL